jgi:hypothetical protein
VKDSCQVTSTHEVFRKCIIETPIHYKARTFGETQISRFRDGWLLLKMVWFAYRKLKAI